MLDGAVGNPVAEGAVGAEEMDGAPGSVDDGAPGRLAVSAGGCAGGLIALIAT